MMKWQTKETYTNEVTGASVPMFRTEGDLVAVDMEYFYIAVPNTYENGVPVVSKLKRSEWEESK